MDHYKDVYEPINWTRLIFLIIALCGTVFYYSTNAFIVESKIAVHHGCAECVVANYCDGRGL